MADTVESISKLGTLDAIVGTPGRVVDCHVAKIFDLKTCTFVVVDGADSMLDRGFLDELEDIVSYLDGPRICSYQSATVPQLDELLKEFSLDRKRHLCIVVDCEKWNFQEHFKK